MLDKHKKLFIILAVIVVLLAGCGASGPENVVLQFYYNVEAGSYERAIDLLAGDFSDSTSREKFKAAFQGGKKIIESKGGLKSIDFRGTEVQGDYATVTAVIVYGNGEKEEDTTDLVREEDGWKITTSK